MNTKAKGFKKLVAMLLFAAMALQTMPSVFAAEAETPGSEVIVEPKNSLDEMVELLNTTTYDEYIKIYKDDGVVEFDQKSKPESVKAVLDVEASSEGVKVLTDPNGILSTKEEDPNGFVSGADKYVLTEDGSTAVFKIKVDKPGFYNIRVPYYPFASLYYDDEGEIIAALVDGDLATLKTYYRDDENKKIVLRAENDDKKNYPDIVRREVRVMGVAVYVMKKL